MKNTLKKKLLVGFTAASILFGSVFGSLAACTKTESNSDNFQKYSVVKMTGNYVLHRNIEKAPYVINTKCGLRLSWGGRSGVSVYNDSEFSSPLSAINLKLYFGKTLEELEKNHFEYTDVCEECFPDGLEAE